MNTNNRHENDEGKKKIGAAYLLSVYLPIISMVIMLAIK